ncbi:nuclear transport factor 2 family protein [Leptothoe spongobia]|uniref:Nuclear transport factor 2 family protein n=1 Tax=Leptothoe spongobia TAU-MAC 1115 TaxID=1967444 RepID=A0A947DIN9_9CYAN|nr:nuclear transport factor 2 family protein [Leptothoe spongobia]MBT9317947.1 nuclear transport factor 2 family protein [Leptothoe spongobia TAU-MAC 1115]
MHQVHVDDQPAMGYSAIVEVIKKYYDALYRCDTELLSQVFHPSAQYFTASSGELLHLDMNTYFPIVEQRISPESLGEAYGFSIDSIEVVGNVTALARMRSSLFSKDYIDLLALIKIDGKWQIISKVFHYTPQINARSEQPSKPTELAGEITCPT